MTSEELNKYVAELPDDISALKKNIWHLKDILSYTQQQLIYNEENIEKERQDYRNKLFGTQDELFLCLEVLENYENKKLQN